MKRRNLSDVTSQLDSFALEQMIARQGAPPPPQVRRPAPQDFSVTLADVSELQRAEEWHEMIAERDTLAKVAGAIVFLPGLVVAVVLTAMETGLLAGIVFVVVMGGTIATYERVRDRVREWQLSRNPHRNSTLPSEKLRQALAYREAERNWSQTEAARLKAWHRNAEQEARIALERDKSIQRLRGTFWTSLSGIEFERELGELYRQNGYAVTHTKASGDQGIDLILRRGTDLVVVQCKQHDKPAGAAFSRDLYGSMMHHGAARAVLACTSGFTAAAHKFCAGKPITLVGLDDILRMAVAVRSDKYEA